MANYPQVYPVGPSVSQVPKTNVFSETKRPPRKKIPSVGDILLLPSGVSGRVTKLIKIGDTVKQINFKKAGKTHMPCQRLSVDDDYRIVTWAKVDRDVPRSTQQHATIDSTGVGQIGDEGKKWFPYCGWLTGRIVSVTTTDGFEVLYLVEFSDGITEYLNEEAVENFKYELTNASNLPEVYPYVHSIHNRDVANANPGKESKHKSRNKKKWRKVNRR